MVLLGRARGSRQTRLGGRPRRPGPVQPALLVSVWPAPDQAGTHGFIVRETRERFAAALVDAWHTAWAFHDPAESHDSLAMGFGADGDRATEFTGAFLDGLR